MRIGVLTIHHVTNYGAVLQAYALSKVLESLRHDVEIIDFRPDNAVRFYRPKLIRRKPPFLVSPERLLQHFRFERFIDRSLRLSGKRFASLAGCGQVLSPYDAIVVGSDQVWCTGDGSFRGMVPEFFLENVSTQQSCRKIAYAVSAGQTKSFGQHECRIKDAIKSFGAISVRDKNTQALARKLYPGDVEIVLDPTLLHSFDEFRAPFKKNATPYILVFGAQLTSAMKVRVKEFAKSIGADIFQAFGNFSRYEARSVVSASPATWVKLMAGASLVITSFYHGVLFATNLRRPFAVIPSSNRAIKVGDFLSSYGLDSRVVENEEFDLGSCLDVTDFATAWERLEEAKHRSEQFLTRALHST